MPAVAVKFATADPAGIRTEAGTLTAAATLLDKDTLAPPDGAAFEIVTEQAVVAEGARLVTAQFSEVTEGEEVTETTTDWLDAPSVAVMLEL